MKISRLSRLFASTHVLENPVTSLPITSFEAKKMAWGKFSLAGESHKFPLFCRKNPFVSNPSFHGKTGHFKGKGKLFSRENYPWEGKFSLSGKIRPIKFIFSLGEEIVPQKMFRVNKEESGLLFPKRQLERKEFGPYPKDPFALKTLSRWKS